MANVKDRLAELGIELPQLPPPRFAYLPGRVLGDTVYVSGQTPTVDGELVHRGRCDEDVDVDTGKQAARLAAINLLAELDAVAGLDNVVQIVKLNGYVASSDGFTDQPAVVNGASELLVEVLGEAGRHARAAVGVAWLPGGAPVEVELIAQLRSGTQPAE